MTAQDVERVQENVRKWLDAEFEIKDFQHPQAHWGFTVKAGDIPLLVLGVKAVDRIDIMGWMNLDGAFLERYRALDAEGLMEFRLAINERGVGDVVDIELQDKEGGVSVEVKRVLYAEDLTRQVLMDAARSVHHHLVGVRITSRRQLTP